MACPIWEPRTQYMENLARASSGGKGTARGQRGFKSGWLEVSEIKVDLSIYLPLCCE
jgi:hypothetical protein